MESCKEECISRQDCASLQDDSSIRREQRRNSIQTQTMKIDEQDVPNLVVWLQDPWSEIRKDAAKAIRAYYPLLTPAAETRLLFSLVESLERFDVSWQVVHGSLLGITVLVNESTDHIVTATIQSLCLKLVGHKLPPVREAAAACMLRLLSTNQLTISQLVSQVLRCLSVCLCNDEGMTLTTDSATTNTGSLQEMDELDGLLGCLQEALVHGSVSIESSLAMLSMTSAVNSVDDNNNAIAPGVDTSATATATTTALATSAPATPTSTATSALATTTTTTTTTRGSSASRTLLHHVLDVVEACMGHPSSSVVRQHAGQIFLLIYNNLPPCNPSRAEEEQPRQDDPSKTATAVAAVIAAPSVAAVSRHSLTYTILLPTLATLAEPHHNHGQQQDKGSDKNKGSDKGKGSDNWQKQEVCLLVAEDVLQNTLQGHLRAMAHPYWRGFDLPASLVRWTTRTTHPGNTSCQHTLSTHPIYKQHTLATSNTPWQHTLSTSNTPWQHERSICHISTPYQPTHSHPSPLLAHSHLLPLCHLSSPLCHHPFTLCHHLVTTLSPLVTTRHHRSLLSVLRQGAAKALLHPQFEIRRMFGQILPLLARVTVVLQVTCPPPLALAFTYPLT